MRQWVLSSDALCTYPHRASWVSWRVLAQSISFDAADHDPGEMVTVDVKLVRERVGDMLIKSDLSKFII